MPSFGWGVGQTGSFSSWVLSGLTVDTDGSLIVTTGQSTGTALSPVTQCPSWQRYSEVSGSGSRPIGTGILIQLRAGATAIACAASAWSPYFDTWDDLGKFFWDAWSFLLNDPSQPDGAFFQLQVTMATE